MQRISPRLPAKPTARANLPEREIGCDELFIELSSV